MNRTATAALAVWVALAGGALARHDGAPPGKLVFDLRLFESRSVSPHYRIMSDLVFSIRTDGRGVTDRQWLATLARRIPESFLASLAYEPISAREPDGTASFSWTNGPRDLVVELQRVDREAAERFPLRVRVRLLRAGRPLREIARTLDVEPGQTTVWTERTLELSTTEYLSHVREYRDAEHRSLLYEELSPYVIQLVVAVTPLRLGADEAAPAPRVRLEPPPAAVPEIDNPFRATLLGSVRIGFGLDAHGRPENPRILRSTVPEVNPRILGEAESWRFDVAARPLPAGGGAEVEIPISIPPATPISP